MSYLLDIYKRFPVSIVKGSGAYIYDEYGNQYLDFTSGIATVNFGHCNEYISERLKSQVDKLWHCSNLFHTKEQEIVAQRFVASTFADKVFFCSSGLEAIEAAIKFVRKHFFVTGNPEKNRIITLKKGFHGRSIAGISAGGGEYAKIGFAPLLDGFDQVVASDINALKSAVTEKTAAILLELVQSEGGVHVIDTEYIKALRKIADENNILLCFDETQTGFGRMGNLFHYQNLGVEPDLLTCAKGIGNGFPLGACLLKDNIALSINQGSHGGTYSGNPLAMAACSAVLDILHHDDFFENVKKTASYLKSYLLDIASEFPQLIREIKGEVMLLGIEFYPHVNAFNFLEECLKNGLAITKTSNQNIIRILPPLIINNNDIDVAMVILRKTLDCI